MEYAADLDTVTGELGRGELARGVGSPLTDQAARGPESAGPRGHVRGLTAGAETDRRPGIGVGREWAVR